MTIQQQSGKQPRKARRSATAIGVIVAAIAATLTMAGAPAMASSANDVSASARTAVAQHETVKGISPAASGDRGQVINRASLFGQPNVFSGAEALADGTQWDPILCWIDGTGGRFFWTEVYTGDPYYSWQWWYVQAGQVTHQPSVPHCG